MTIDQVRLWLRSLLLRGRVEREMQEEMAGHLERSVERLMGRGLSAEEARREALLEFGNVAYLQEEARHARGARWLDALQADSRFALRQFRRRWATVLTMFVILSLGMSISTVLFWYVHAYAVQPPPSITLEDDMVRIRGSQDAGAGGRGVRGFTLDEVQEYRRLDDQFTEVAAWSEAEVSADVGDADALQGLPGEAIFVTENYFGVLGLRPILGPGLPAVALDDPAEEMVAVLSHVAWDRLFGSSPDVIGRTVEVNGVPVTIVGVAPPRFHGIGGARSLQLWLPLGSRHSILPASTVETLAFRAAGRLRPGVEAAAATAAAGVVAARAAASDPRLAERDPGTEVVPLLGTNGDPMHERDVRAMAVVMGVLALLVLAVGCTNVGALQTGLAMARRQEIAIRLSLGAARTRIVRQLLTESALLAVAAGATALGILWVVFTTLRTRFPLLPFTMEITWPAAVFTFGVALGSGILFGVSPALHATRIAIASALQDSATAIAATRLRLQRALVVAQIALTQPLIVLLSAVLLVVLGSLQPTERSPFADQLISLRLRPVTSGPGNVLTPESLREREEEGRRLLARLESVPGVAAAVMNSESRGDLGRFAIHAADRVMGGSEEAFALSGETAPEGYFAVAGLPLLRGRQLTASDPTTLEGTGEVPVVIGGDLARRLWPGADAVGRRLQPAGDSVAGKATLVVAGVVAEREGAEKTLAEGARIYLPAGTGGARPNLLIRTLGPAESLIPHLRATAREEAPGMAVSMSTVATLEDQARRTFRIVTGALAGGGLVTLLLSAIGLYAVVAFSVGQRTGEIAVRLAVGAPPGRIVRRFVVDGLRLSLIGVVLGLPLGLLCLRGYNVLAVLDGDVESVALAPVAGIATLAVVLVTVAATLVPARRASRVSPVAALRRE